MAIEVDRLVATLEANFSKYDKALSKLQSDSDASFSKVESRGKEMEARLSKLGLGGSLFAGIGAGIAGGLIASFSFDKIKGAIKDVANIGKVADQVGTTTDALQELRYAAEKAGAPISSMDQALVAFGEHVSQAASGKLNDFSRILAANGIALKDQAGNVRSQSALFADYADLIKNAASQQDRLRLAQTAFGAAGTSLVTTLRNGADGLRDAATEAHELGRVLSVDAVNAAQQLNDDFDSIINSMDTKFKRLVVSVVQGAAEIAHAFNSTMAAYGKGDLGGQSLETLTAAKEKVEREISDLQARNTGIIGFMAGSALDTQIKTAQARLDQINDQIAQSKAEMPTPPPTTPENPTIIPPPPRRGRHPATRLTADQRIDEDIQGVRDRTAALKEEAATVGLSYEEQQKRRMALDLEQEALKRLRMEAARKGETDLDSIHLSPEQVAKIDAVSEVYGRQAAALRKVQEDEQKAEQAASEFYGTFKSDALDAITGAKSLGEALEDLGRKFASLMINSAFDSLFAPRTGGSSGGLFGGLFSSLGNFLTGRYASGTNSASGGPALVGEKGPEIVNLPRGSQVVPADITRKIIGGSDSSGGISLTYAPQNNFQGTSQELADFRRQAERDRADFSARVIQTIRKANKTNVKLN
jgi:hypothetical protein